MTIPTKAAERAAELCTPFALFTNSLQVQGLVLPEGHRFVAFVRGENPVIVPIDEPGNYEIDIPALLAKGKWPVGVGAFPMIALPAITKLSADAVGAMLNSALLASPMGAA